MHVHKLLHVLPQLISIAPKVLELIAKPVLRSTAIKRLNILKITKGKVTTCTCKMTVIHALTVHLRVYVHSTVAVTYLNVLVEHVDPLAVALLKIIIECKYSSTLTEVLKPLPHSLFTSINAPFFIIILMVFVLILHLMTSTILN